MGRKQARQNRIIMLAVAGLAAVIILILAVGLIREFVLKPAEPVATVNGAEIRTDDYQTLLRYRRFNLHANIDELQANLQTIDTTDEANEFLVTFYQQQVQQLQTSLGLAPQETLDEMIEHQLIRQKAEEVGITVTEAEVKQTIDDELRRAFSPAPSTVVTDTEDAPTPTPIPDEQLDQLYQNILDNMGLSENEFEGIIQRNLYRNEVQEYLAGQVVTTGLVVHIQLIETDTEEAATTARQRIELGEEFDVVAREVSTDTQSVENGGDLGWVITGQLAPRYGEDLENLVFSLEPGKLEQVESNGQFYVVQVLERDENGTLPPEVISQRQNNALTEWLAEQKESPDVEIERLLEPDQIPPDPFAQSLVP